MLTLNFIVEPQYILWHTLTNIGNEKFTIPEGHPDRIKIENFQDDNTDLTEIFYEYPAFEKSIRSIFTSDMYEKTLNSMSFAEIVGDVRNSMVPLENEWHRYSSKINTFLSKIGVKIQETHNISFTHPGLIKDSNRYTTFIPWVKYTDSAYENMLSLIKEIMSSFFAEYYSNNESTHVLIHILVYQELGAYLSNKNIPLPKADPNTEIIIRRINPLIKEYINSKSTDIEKLLTECEILITDLM